MKRSPTNSILAFLRTTNKADPEFYDYVEWMNLHDPHLAHYPVISLIREFVILTKGKDNVAK